MDFWGPKSSLRVISLHVNQMPFQLLLSYCEKNGKSNRLRSKMKKQQKPKITRAMKKYMKSVDILESGEQRPIYEILRIKLEDYPPVSSLNEQDLKQKFEQLKKTMLKHNFSYELSEKLPISEAYRYLTEVFLPDYDTIIPDGCTCHVTGCHGNCPDCIQSEYCDVEQWR
jgi:hypothetical protein